MTPWSKKKFGAFLSLFIIVVSFFSPYAIVISGYKTEKHIQKNIVFAEDPIYTPVPTSPIEGWPTIRYHGDDAENEMNCDLLGGTETNEKPDACDGGDGDNESTEDYSIYDAFQDNPAITFTDAIKQALGTEYFEHNTEVSTVPKMDGFVDQTLVTNADGSHSLKIRIKLHEDYDTSATGVLTQAHLFLFSKTLEENDSQYRYEGWTPYTETAVEGADGAPLADDADPSEIYQYFRYEHTYNVLPNTTYNFAFVAGYWKTTLFGGGEEVDGKIEPVFFSITTPDWEVTEADTEGTDGAAVDTAFNNTQLDAWCVRGLINVSVVGCLGELFQDALFPLFSSLMYITGKFFDIMANFTLGSDSYGDQVAFIESGWTLVRDFSNILFIVALVYLAFGVIFDLHSVNVKKSIASIIIMALMVNFSLFFTRVIIDTSNILARIFYAQIALTDTDGDSGLTEEELTEQNISLGIASGFNPQKLISDDVLTKFNQEVAEGRMDPNRLVLTLYSMATVVVAITCWVFFATSFNFIQRTISLWLAMIFAPFAFVSLAFPFGLSGLKRIGWHSWLKDLLCWCFFAPLFFFFLYLTISFAGSGFLEDFISKAATMSIYEYIIYIIFPFAIVITLLMYSKNLAKSLGCDGADALVGAGMKLAGGVAGVGMMAVSGGTSALLSRTVGARANKELNSEKGTLLKAAAAGDARAMVKLRQMDSSYKGMKAADIQKSAEKKVKGLQKNASRSWDMRNTVGAQAVSGALGINMNAGAGAAKWMTKGAMGFSTADTAGGYKARVERDAQKQIDFIKSLGYDHHKAKELGEKIKEGKNIGKQLRAENEQDRKAIEALQDTKKGGEKNLKEKTDALASLKAQKPSDYAGPEARKEYEDKVKAAEEEVKNAEKGAGSVNESINELNDTIKRRSGRMKDLNDQVSADREKKEKIEKGYVGTYARYMEYQAEAGPKTWRGQVSNSFQGFNAKDWRTWGKVFGQGAMGTLAGAALLGPVGAVGGAFVGSVNGATKGGFLDALKNTLEVNQMQFNKDVAETLQSEADGHFHAGHYKDTYKPVMTGLAKFFENLAKGGIEIKGGGGHGGGGHGGGGHDSHGGGGGHH